MPIGDGGNLNIGRTFTDGISSASKSLGGKLASLKENAGNVMRSISEGSQKGKAEQLSQSTQGDVRYRASSYLETPENRIPLDDTPQNPKVTNQQSSMLEKSQYDHSRELNQPYVITKKQEEKLIVDFGDFFIASPAPLDIETEKNKNETVPKAETTAQIPRSQSETPSATPKLGQAGTSTGTTLIKAHSAGTKLSPEKETDHLDYIKNAIDAKKEEIRQLEKERSELQDMATVAGITGDKDDNEMYSALANDVEKEIETKNKVLKSYEADYNEMDSINAPEPKTSVAETQLPSEPEKVASTTSDASNVTAAKRPSVDSLYGPKDATPHRFNPLEYGARKLRDQVMDTFAKMKPKISDIKNTISDVKTKITESELTEKQKAFLPTGNPDIIEISPAMYKKLSSEESKKKMQFTEDGKKYENWTLGEAIHEGSGQLRYYLMNPDSTSSWNELLSSAASKPDINPSKQKESLGQKIVGTYEDVATGERINKKVAPDSIAMGLLNKAIGSVAGAVTGEKTGSAEIDAQNQSRIWGASEGLEDPTIIPGEPSTVSSVYESFPRQRNKPLPPTPKAPHRPLPRPPIANTRTETSAPTASPAPPQAASPPRQSSTLTEDRKKTPIFTRSSKPTPSLNQANTKPSEEFKKLSDNELSQLKAETEKNINDLNQEVQKGVKKNALDHLFKREQDKLAAIKQEELTRSKKTETSAAPSLKKPGLIRANATTRKENKQNIGDINKTLKPKKRKKMTTWERTVDQTNKNQINGLDMK